MRAKSIRISFAVRPGAADVTSTRSDRPPGLFPFPRQRQFLKDDRGIVQQFADFRGDDQSTKDERRIDLTHRAEHDAAQTTVGVEPFDNDDDRDGNDYRVPKS